MDEEIREDFVAVQQLEVALRTRKEALQKVLGILDKELEAVKVTIHMLSRTDDVAQRGGGNSGTEK